ASHRRREPLVGIDGDRVRKLDPRKGTPQVIRGNEGPGPSCVHVKPKTMLSRERGARFERIDHAGARSPGCCCHHYGKPAVGPIMLDRRGELMCIHTPCAIRGDHLSAGSAKSCLLGNLDPCEMALARDVEYGLAGEDPHALLYIVLMRARECHEECCRVRL